MKKKFLTLLLCLSTLSILVACGSNDSDKNNNSPIKNQSPEVPSQNSPLLGNYFDDKTITADNVLNNDDDNDDNSDGNTVTNEISSNNTASNNNSADENNNSTINNSAQEVQTTPTQTEYSSKFKDVNECLADEEVMHDITIIKSQIEAEGGYYADIYGNYDTIVYKFTSKTNMIPDDVTFDGFKMFMDAYLEGSKPNFRAIANELQPYIEVSPIKIVIEIYNYDNTLLCSGELTAE